MSFLLNNKRASVAKRKQGFTLVELLISVSIIMILSVTLYVQQKKFDSAIFMRNTAQSIALAVREAQTYSVSSVGGTAGGDSYGIHFTTAGAGSGEQYFIFFKDTHPSTPNGAYDEGDDELIDRYTLTGANKITRLVVDPGGSNTSCDTLTITFRRPNPEPKYVCNGTTEVTGQPANIILRNEEEGIERNIEVLRTGQIQVK